MKPLFNLDFENPDDPAKARIADPGNETPIPTISYELGCGFGYNAEGFGSGLDSSGGEIGLSYPTAGNIDFKRGTLEFWYRPKWNLESPSINWEVSLFAAKDQVSQKNEMRIWIDSSGNPIESTLRFEYTSDGNYSYQSHLELKSENWKEWNWNHIAVSWDEEHGLRLFLNGTAIDPDSTTDSDHRGPMLGIGDSPDTMTIGYLHWDPQSPASYFRTRGLIDDFRIFEDFTEDLSFIQQTLVLPFDGSSDSILRHDVSFDPQPVSISSSPEIKPWGVRDEALSLEGDSFLEVPAQGILSPNFGAVDFWFRVTDPASTYGGIFHLHSTPDPSEPDQNSDDGIKCWYEDSKIKVSFGDEEGNNVQLEATATPNNRWHHVAILYRNPATPLRDVQDEVGDMCGTSDWGESGGGYKLVLDGGGALDEEDWDDAVVMYPSGKLEIGRASVYGGSSYSTKYFHGEIDHFRTWNYPRLPREKVLGITGKTYTQLRLDRLNYIDLMMYEGTITIDSMDIAGLDDTPGFVVRDQKVTESGAGDEDDFYSARSSYYEWKEVVDDANNENVYAYSEEGPPMERAKLNDYKIIDGPIRSTVEVRSYCTNDDETDNSGYGIARYHFYAEAPFIRNFFTFVITKPSNPDPLYDADGGTKANLANGQARKYRELALKMNMPKANTLSYTKGLSDQLVVEYSSTEGWVFQSYRDEYAHDIGGDGEFQPNLTPTAAGPGSNRISITNLNVSESYESKLSDDTRGRMLPQVHDSNERSYVNQAMSGRVSFSKDQETGTSFMVKDLAQMHPKKFYGKNETGTIGLWSYQRIDPAPGDDPGVSKVLLDRGSLRYLYFVHQGRWDPEDEGYFLDFNVPGSMTIFQYPSNDHGQHAEFADALGLSRTHELLILPITPKVNDNFLTFKYINQINRFFQDQIFAVPDPSQLCQAMAENELAPYDATSSTNEATDFINRIDAAQRASFDAMMKQDAFAEPVGMFNWGDSPSRWNYTEHTMDDTYRQWAGNHHGIPRLLWLNFFRTGDAGYLDQALRKSLKLADTFWIHWDGNNNTVKLHDKRKGSNNKYNGIVPWSSAFFNGDSLQVDGDGNRVPEHNYNAEVDYLLWYSYMTGNPWGVETAFDFLRLKREEFNQKIEANSFSNSDVTIRKRFTYERWGAGQLSSLLSLYYPAIENLQEPERDSAMLFFEEQFYEPSGTPTPDDEDKFLAYGMRKAHTYGGRYNAGGGSRWRQWAPWLQKLILLYDVNGESRDDDLKNESLGMLQKWLEHDALLQRTYNFRSSTWADKYNLDWKALGLMRASEFPTPIPSQVLEPQRESWKYLEDVFGRSVYEKPGMIYNNLHADGPGRDSADYYYLYQNLAYWISAVRRDLESTSGVLQGQGPDLFQPRFNVSLVEPTQTPIATQPVCPSWGVHPDTQMTIEFDEGSTIRPFAIANDSHLPYFFFNFDDETAHPGNQSIGATVYTGGEDHKQRNLIDYGQLLTTRDLVDDPSGVFGKGLRVNSPEDIMLIESPKALKFDSAWTISFWVRREWADQETGAVFPVFDYHEYDDGTFSGGTVFSHAGGFRIQIVQESTDDHYKIEMGTYIGSGCGTTGLGGDESVSVQGVEWTSGTWKKVIVGVRPKNGSGQSYLRLNVVDRTNCSGFKHAYSQTKNWVTVNYNNTAYTRGFVSVGGWRSGIPSAHCSSPGGIQWDCMIDNVMLDHINPANNALVNALFNTSLTTLAFYVYRDRNADFDEPVMFDADYRTHLSYLEAENFSAVDIYPGIGLNTNLGAVVSSYGMWCPISDDPEERIDARNRSNYPILIDQQATVRLLEDEGTGYVRQSSEQIHLHPRRGHKAPFTIKLMTDDPEPTPIQIYASSTPVSVNWSSHDAVQVHPVTADDNYLWIEATPVPERIRFRLPIPTPTPSP